MAAQIQDQASSVQRELEASLQQSEFAKTMLADELDSTNHKLEEIRAQLQLAEQVSSAGPAGSSAIPDPGRLDRGEETAASRRIRA